MKAKAGRGKRQQLAESSKRGLKEEIHALPQPLSAQGVTGSGKANNGQNTDRQVGKLLPGEAGEMAGVPHALQHWLLTCDSL